MSTTEKRAVKFVLAWRGYSAGEIAGFDEKVAEQLVKSKVVEEYAAQGDNASATQTPAKLDWAQIAVDTGYSDQSHMIRTTRRITGFTPEALGKGIQLQESFWAYRLWM